MAVGNQFIVKLYLQCFVTLLSKMALGSDFLGTLLVLMKVMKTDLTQIKGPIEAAISAF